ncbi:hypothetical protein [Deinococcus sp. QL22]|uniref:hypothetical protein n=1 Tax=Deinococcus sp. QL22 TaxID=2939437 RepID=UPI002017C40C|nr:hypothetical protein [Deinococcus sp. QL22]UQN07926.1 hypothetical protein M1R55_17645 [Deinococcus sp. QL22]
MLHTWSGVVLMSILVSCSPPSQDGQDIKRVIRAAVEASPTVFGRLFKASKVGDEIPASQAFTALIPPNKSIESIMQNSGHTLESFASSSKGKDFVRNHLLTKEVDIRVSNVYVNLLGKQVTITVDESPCRSVFNGVGVRICSEHPDTNLLNGSIYFLSDILPF